MSPPDMTRCVIANVQKYRRNVEVLETTAVAPLKTVPEEKNWSLGGSGSFYDQLGARYLDQDDEVMTDLGRAYPSGYLHGAVSGDILRKHDTISFGWTLFGYNFLPIATHSGTFPCHREERIALWGPLLAMCTATKIIQLCGHCTESKNPTILFVQAT
jgi:hypothetical protein